VCARRALDSDALLSSAGTPVSPEAASTRPGTIWQAPPESLILDGGEVHVWRIALDVPARCVQALSPLLSPDETTRAERFLLEVVRSRFIVSHGATRRILSRYLHTEPEAIRFTTSARGKPAVVATDLSPPIRFSLSHSEDVALCAVARDRELGVDVERLRAVATWRQIADRTFAQDEIQALRAVDEERAGEAFLRCWTRKEAYSKARGEGITGRWTQFAVSLEPDAVTLVRDDAPTAASLGPFALVPLDPGPGYVGALAVQGTGGRFACWLWP